MLICTYNFLVTSIMRPEESFLNDRSDGFMEKYLLGKWAGGTSSRLRRNSHK